jgi:hypothetical protein
MSVCLPLCAVKQKSAAISASFALRTTQQRLLVDAQSNRSNLRRFYTRSSSNQSKFTTMNPARAAVQRAMLAAAQSTVTFNAGGTVTMSLPSLAFAQHARQPLAAQRGSSNRRLDMRDTQQHPEPPNTIAVFPPVVVHRRALSQTRLRAAFPSEQGANASFTRHRGSHTSTAPSVSAHSPSTITLHGV